MSPCYIYWCSTHWPECRDSILLKRTTVASRSVEQNPVLRYLDEKRRLADNRPSSQMPAQNEHLRKQIHVPVLDAKEL